MARKIDQKKSASKKLSVNIKKGDTVKVIAGKDKGAEGKVIQVLREEQRVIVEGVNRVKKHTKVVNQGGRAGTTGGIITAEAPIHVSNVMLVEGDGVTRAEAVVVVVSLIRFPCRSCGRCARSAPPRTSSRRDGAW
jgi:large subunit ribosomal protein L24